MKETHYKVIIRYVEYGEPYASFGVEQIIVYKTLEEILHKFPSFRENLEPNDNSEYGDDNYLTGDSYHGIFLSHVQLTYDEISKERPTEEQLKKDYSSTYED